MRSRLANPTCCTLTMSILKTSHVLWRAYAIPPITLRNIPFGNPNPLPVPVVFYGLKLTNVHRIHWFSPESRLKVVMPSMLHECAGSWLVKNMMQAAMEGLIPDVWNHTMGMMTAPGMLLHEEGSQRTCQAKSLLANGLLLYCSLSPRVR